VPRPLPKKISELKSVIGNVALTSHYMVEFAGLPGNLRRYLAERGIDSRYVSETIGLLCSKAILPGSGFATADVVGNYMGVLEKFAHTRTFTPMSLEFYCDNSYRALKFIEHWMEFMSSGTEFGPDAVSNLTPGYYYRMQYPDQYKCDQTRITKFEKDHKKYIEYRFFGLYPISLDSTTVSYDGSNVLKISATFQYERYVSGQSSSLAQFLNINGNKDPSPSGTGTGADVLQRNNANLTYAGGKTADLSNKLDNGAAVKLTGTDYFGKGSSTILNSTTVTQSTISQSRKI